MRFSEYINEEKEVSLIGMTIDVNTVTQETKNMFWPNDFVCSERSLTTLVGAPKEVGGIFCCDNNKLTSLVGCPKKIGGYFDCTHNKITSLEGIPTSIRGNCYCYDNELTNLKDIHKMITTIRGHFFCNHNLITSHVLGLLMISELTKVVCDNDGWGNILNRYLGKGRKGMLDCQNELIEAGYEEYAQL